MDEPTYDVDEDTRDLLTEVLSLAQRVVDLQYDDETAEELESVCITVGRRFGIESHQMTVTECDGGYLVKPDKPDKPEAKPRWTPTVISNDLEPEQALDCDEIQGYNH